MERFLSYLNFYPSEKVAPPFIRVEKNSSLGVQGIKRSGFCADFKNVQKSRVWQKGKNLLLKN